MCDFGLAKVLDRHSQVVMTGVGTRTYFSPELLRHIKALERGEKGCGYKWSVDIWAIGLIFYELSALCHPFEEPAIQKKFNSMEKSIEFAPINPVHSNIMSYKIILS